MPGLLAICAMGNVKVCPPFGLSFHILELFLTVLWDTSLLEIESILKLHLLETVERLTLPQVGLSRWQCPHQGANIITMWSPLSFICQQLVRLLSIRILDLPRNMTLKWLVVEHVAFSLLDLEFCFTQVYRKQCTSMKEQHTSHLLSFLHSRKHILATSLQTKPLPVAQAKNGSELEAKHSYQRIVLWSNESLLDAYLKAKTKMVQTTTRLANPTRYPDISDEDSFPPSAPSSWKPTYYLFKILLSFVLQTSLFQCHCFEVLSPPLAFGAFSSSHFLQAVGSPLPTCWMSN